ncbi:MAG: hypothetical protein IPL79_01330 [Myxococcales bacterium]|nr:hypothetical protein [Myxococcales bacterium]
MAKGAWSYRRYATLGALALGWVFVLAQHNFRFTPSAVMLGLAWLCLVWSIQTVWAMADAAASPTDRASWWRHKTPKQELKLQKASLLRALKEIEFDRDTGKLSAQDAESLAATYRQDAIEVMRQLDALDASADASVHGEIKAELARRRAAAGKGTSGKKAAST